EGDREHLVRMSAQFAVRATRDVPHPNDTVLATGGEPAAVRAERGRVDERLVAGEGWGLLVRPGVPQDDGCSVLTPRCQPAAVGAVGHTGAVGREQPLTGRHVADVQAIKPRLPVKRRRGDPGPVRADGEEPGRLAEAGNLPADACRPDVPDPQPV